MNSGSNIWAILAYIFVTAITFFILICLFNITRSWVRYRRKMKKATREINAQTTTEVKL